MTLRGNPLRFITAMLLAGMMMTVASAWLSAMLPLTVSTFIKPLPAAGERVKLLVRVPDDFQTREWLVYSGMGGRRDQISEMKFVGSTFGAMSGQSNRHLDRFSAGFPFATMQASMPWDAVDRFSPSDPPAMRFWRGGIPWRTRTPKQSGVLPVRPLPARFAFSVVMWTCLFADLARTVRVVRRARRRTANCCMTCGYSLRGVAAGATCPECGVAHASTS